MISLLVGFLASVASNSGGFEETEHQRSEDDKQTSDGHHNGSDDRWNNERSEQREK